jgi:hypothetical protein
LQIIGDLTATAEVGKTYLGKVTRLAEFGAFVEIIPGTDGLLHISEVAEHRIKDIRDELKEGDQVLVKVLAVEGNRIKLSRKAILKEQRAKMGGGPAPDAPVSEAAPVAAPVPAGVPSAVIEGGADFDEDDEPNFNRVDAPVSTEPVADRGRPDRGPRPVVVEVAVVVARVVAVVVAMVAAGAMVVTAAGMVDAAKRGNAVYESRTRAAIKVVALLFCATITTRNTSS